MISPKKAIPLYKAREQFLETVFYNRNKQVLIVCLDKEEAYELIDYLEDFITDNFLLDKAVMFFSKYNDYSIRFNNGSILTVKSMKQRLRGLENDEVYFYGLTHNEANKIEYIIRKDTKYEFVR